MQDVTIVYKSMGIWTEVEVTTQTFHDDARVILVARQIADRPISLMEPDKPSVEIMLNRANMRRLALHLLMESMG